MTVVVLALLVALGLLAHSLCVATRRASRQEEERLDADRREREKDDDS